MEDLQKKRGDFFSHDFSKAKSQKRTRKFRISYKKFGFLSKSFMEASYLVSPEVLNESEYFVSIEPNLVKCMVLTQENSTFVISTNGKQLLQAKTFLPNHYLSSPNTMLEGFYVNNTEILIQDVLLWNTIDYRNAPLHTRFSFLQETFQSLPQTFLKFSQLEYFPVTSESISHCYQNPHQKALVFHNTLGIYQSALSHDRLIWTDNPHYFQETCLECRADGRLVTLDELTVYKLNKKDLDFFGVFTGKILRCDIGKIEGFSVKELKNLKETTGKASSWSQIYFEWLLKSELISLNQLINIKNKMSIDPDLEQQEDISEFLNDFSG